MLFINKFTDRSRDFTVLKKIYKKMKYEYVMHKNSILNLKSEVTLILQAINTTQN